MIPMQAAKYASPAVSRDGVDTKNAIALADHMEIALDENIKRSRIITSADGTFTITATDGNTLPGESYVNWHRLNFSEDDPTVIAAMEELKSRYVGAGNWKDLTWKIETWENYPDEFDSSRVLEVTLHGERAAQ